jgi:hypothetical protein
LRIRFSNSNVARGFRSSLFKKGLWASSFIIRLDDILDALEATVTAKMSQSYVFDYVLDESEKTLKS